uniref:Uncharacterized protein n=1 Tax=Anopheles farauti TaxID=69004 RepID=A0A182QHB6_9DIPT
MACERQADNGSGIQQLEARLELGVVEQNQLLKGRFGKIDEIHGTYQLLLLLLVNGHGWFLEPLTLEAVDEVLVRDRGGHRFGGLRGRRLFLLDRRRFGDGLFGGGGWWWDLLPGQWERLVRLVVVIPGGRWLGVVISGRLLLCRRCLLQPGETCVRSLLHSECNPRAEAQRWLGYDQCHQGEQEYEAAAHVAEACGTSAALASTLTHIVGEGGLAGTCSSLPLKRAVRANGPKYSTGRIDYLAGNHPLITTASASVSIECERALRVTMATRGAGGSK